MNCWRHVECQSAFRIRNLGTGNCCLVTGGLQAALSFVAALKQISDSEVELLALVKVVGTEIVGTKNGNELGIKMKRWIGAQVCGDLLRLVLKNESARRLERVIVHQRQIDCLIQGDQSCALRLDCGHEQQQPSQSCQDLHPEMRWTHKAQI